MAEYLAGSLACCWMGIGIIFIPGLLGINDDLPTTIGLTIIGMVIMFFAWPIFLVGAVLATPVYLAYATYRGFKHIWENLNG